MANPPYGDSTKDPICPTYAASTISVCSAASAGANILNDSAKPGSANGYTNQNNYENTVGGFNNSWSNGCNSKNVAPVFRSGLASFGNTGRQS